MDILNIENFFKKIIVKDLREFAFALSANRFY